MAATCQAHIQQCVRCACANAWRGGQAGRVRTNVPSRPWQEVVMDTLQIAADRSGQFHCVLMLVDAFSKWAAVVPLRHQDARSVAEAFSELLPWNLYTAWCSEIGSLTSLDACNSGAFSDVREPISLHQAVFGRLEPKPSSPLGR